MRGEEPHHGGKLGKPRRHLVILRYHAPPPSMREDSQLKP